MELIKISMQMMMTKIILNRRRINKIKMTVRKENKSKKETLKNEMKKIDKE